ncbi:MAG TPA: C25 family cysteine peptidase [Anaerolineaceae bacterium]|nr:C25 family cysteine peptidase [Anaerolineaceae bacterium]
MANKGYFSKFFKISLLAVFFVVGLHAMPVEAQTGIDQWLVFDSETESEVPELALLSASADAIEIQAIMPGARLGETNIAGQNYLTLSGEGYGVIGQVGAPALPVLRKMVEIPLESDVSLELLQSNTTIISLARLGVKGIIAPVQPSQPKCGEPKPAVSATDTLYGRGFFPAEPLAIVDDFIMRGHRIVVVEIRPVRYNEALAELEVTSAMTFRLKLEGSNMDLTFSEANRLNSAPFNRLLQPTVLNFNQGLPVAIPNTNELYLIISADMFEAGLTDFVTLKESQGFSVSVANLTTVGGNTTTAIKNYIKTQYLGANPPDYVLLVGDYVSGDPAGSLTNYTMRTASSYRTDLQYFTMDNETEYVPDILYGRFPVRTAAHLSAMIDKYEAYQDANGNEDWVKKIEYLASNDGTYYYVAERTHNYVIDSYTLPKGYTGIFPSNPQAGGDKVYAITYGGDGTDAVASMNDHRAMVVYSGHGGTTFWDAPYVNQTNVRNLTGVAIPYVASHACITADFRTDEAFSDTWVIEPVNGALTFFGSSNSTYWYEDEDLETAIFDHLYSDPNLDIIPSVAAITQYGLQAVDNSGTSLDNYYRETYHIFGDPSLEILMKPRFPDFRISVDPTAIKTCNDESNIATVNLASVNEYAEPVNLTAFSLAGFTTTFAINPITPSGSTIASIEGDGTAVTGMQTLVLTGTSETLIHTAEIELSIFAPITSGPQLQTPANNSRGVSPLTSFVWTSVPNAETYRLQVSTDPGFTMLVVDQAGIVETTFTLPANLATDTQYFWRVKAESVCGNVVSAHTFTFRTNPGPGDCGEGTEKQVIFFDDFEGGLGAWQNPGDTFRFDITTVRAYSAVSAVLASVPDALSDQRLITPPMTIPDSVETVSLIFWHRWTFDSLTACNDGAILEVTSDGGASWTQVANADLLTNPYNGTIKSGVFNPLGNKQGWCYGTNDWVRTVVQLTAYKGKTVQFRFRLGTGLTGEAEGWYIDDLLLQACVANAQPYKVFLPSVLGGN